MKGRTALITGSTGGLGLATATALAAEGYNIVMTGLGDLKEVEVARQSIETTHGVPVRYIAADLQRPAEIEQMVAEARSVFGSIDVLVNNAVIRHFNAIENFLPADWDQEIAVNLTAPFHLARLTLGAMKAANWGRIINLSSNTGIFAVPNRPGYVTTKTALLGLTRAIAAETLGTGITCNAICPSAMIGANAEKGIARIMQEDGLSRDAAIEAFLAKRQRARFVTTVPALIVFLCGEGGKDMTGTTIPVDLGSTAGQREALNP